MASPTADGREAGLLLSFPAELRPFLPAKRRGAGPVRVGVDGVSSLGHVVEALGVPLTEVGSLSVAGRGVDPAYRPRPGDRVEVRPVRRPQWPRPRSPRFLLDVHLGALARQLRLLGVDTAYDNDMGDAELVARADAERRVLLTRDRGLLRRRSLWLGAYVRGDDPDRQLADVLDRFEPPLAPWTRCTVCNTSPLTEVRKADVEPLLRPGTRRTHDSFTRCPGCGRVYWRGAHSERLERIVAEARERAAHAGTRSTGGRRRGRIGGWWVPAPPVGR
ncbi:Mut7-C RNAse domain-containing protein [Streptomyces sp. Da 82-17]|uniref:Mut7-C RNAse domain-containing protein n=1 Tax=Streptomyces sp. Da 82-17 TaxID=3377116 RepID=UPI0038D38E6A